MGVFHLKSILESLKNLAKPHVAPELEYPVSKKHIFHSSD